MKEYNKIMPNLKDVSWRQEPQMFVDLLDERRNKSDVAWTFRTLDIVAPHKLPTGRQYSLDQIINAVLTNPRVVLLTESLASLRNVPVATIRNEARDMLNEMAGRPQLPTIRCLGVLVTKALKRILKRVRINQSYLLELKTQMGIEGVQYVYVPTHRSYLDFILVSYALFANDMAIPNIASGMDFYKMSVVGELLRKSGAFYMRRSFATDQLYKEVFRAYISCLVAHSERAIEFFIEGTRSRGQKSLAPKYGLLSMILEGLWKGDVSDIRFVPISITYDRPLEELLFAYELLGVPKPPESTKGLFKSLSILQEPCAYGNVYMTVAPPISARQFFDFDTLSKGCLSPYSKIPSNVLMKLAYAIIDSHKDHTPLSPFNLIALLFNERVHTHPRKPYNLQSLITDYCWLKEFFSRAMNCLINPGTSRPGSSQTDDDVKNEVLESLFIHRELLRLDASGELKLIERHQNRQSCDPKKVKGHPLTNETMRLAVSAINITIYTNPSMAFLIKPAFIAVSVTESSIARDTVFARYKLLRELLSTEFAFCSGESLAIAEWEEGLALLVSEDCIRLENNVLVMGSNTRLFSLLQNLLLPFLVACHATCAVLHKWNDEMGEAKERVILRNTQKEVEWQLLQGNEMFRYPYALSLDLYATTLASLVSMGIVSSSGRSPDTTYSSNKIRLHTLLEELDNFKTIRPSGSYLDIDLLPVTPVTIIPHAKL